MSAQPMENPMNNNQDMFKPFHGSIDELLDHVNNKIDAGAVERIVVDKTEDVLLNNETAIQLIMSEADVNKEIATDILNEIKMEEIYASLAKLVEDGLIEVVKYDEDGQPLYGLTSNGAIVAKQFHKKG